MNTLNTVTVDSFETIFGRGRWRMLANACGHLQILASASIEGAQMGSGSRDRDIAKLRNNSQNVNGQTWLRNFA